MNKLKLSMVKLLVMAADKYTTAVCLVYQYSISFVVMHLTLRPRSVRGPASDLSWNLAGQWQLQWLLGFLAAATTSSPHLLVSQFFFSWLKIHSFQTMFHLYFEGCHLFLKGPKPFTPIQRPRRLSGRTVPSLTLLLPPTCVATTRLKWLHHHLFHI